MAVTGLDVLLGVHCPHRNTNLVAAFIRRSTPPANSRQSIWRSVDQGWQIPHLPPISSLPLGVQVPQELMFAVAASPGQKSLDEEQVSTFYA